MQTGQGSKGGLGNGWFRPRSLRSRQDGPAPAREQAALRQLRRNSAPLRVRAEGPYVFLVGPGEDDVTPEQVVHVPDLTTGALRELLARFDGDTAVSGWLVEYDRYRRDELALPDWLACVERLTQELHERLLAPVRERLRLRYPRAERLVRVPNQGLTLLPLHAIWWREADDERRYLLDEYDVAYTPSAQVLRLCLNRERGHPGSVRGLFAV
jgi:hypothetical protein